MTLYAGTIPPEMLRLAMDTRREIERARAHIESHNYGLADESLEAALALLPFDNGEHLVWPELEDRTT